MKNQTISQNCLDVTHKKFSSQSEKLWLLRNKWGDVPILLAIYPLWICTLYLNASTRHEWKSFLIYCIFLSNKLKTFGWYSAFSVVCNDFRLRRPNSPTFFSTRHQGNVGYCLPSKLFKNIKMWLQLSKNCLSKIDYGDNDIRQIVNSTKLTAKIAKTINLPPPSHQKKPLKIIPPLVHHHPKERPNSPKLH